MRNPGTPTNNAQDVEGLRLLHLPVELSAAHVGPVLQQSLEALTGNIKPADGRISVHLMQGDGDVGISDQAGDCAFVARLGHHAMGALYEPHLGICTQKHVTLNQSEWRSNN